MPITKSLTVKSERYLKESIKYILNPDKTNEQVLTSGYKINHVNNAAFEMELTRKMARQFLGDSNKKSDQEVVARHLIQSFDPNDNLTPKEVHEIGRQTVLELTGGNHEFIIATHIDQEHLHNHIIFNATSVVDLKKFRWQRGTTNLLRSISDKIADYHGASILKNAKRNSYTKYQEYRKKNAFRTELKARLNFLLKHSLDWEDYQLKANLLGIEIDENHQSKDYGQVVNYKLLDLPQKRPARDYTLNQKYRIYAKNEVEERTKKNVKESVFSSVRILTEYEKEKQAEEAIPDLVMTVQPWQIERDTMTGIYLSIEYGRYEKGLIKIPDYKLDQQSDGSYKAYFKYTDNFYFLNNERVKSKFVKGADVVKVLSGESGFAPKRKNSAIQNVRNMAAALNLISERNVKGSQVVEALGESFVEDLEQVKSGIEKLNEKIISEMKKLKFEPQRFERLEKVKALQEERKELQKGMNHILKQLKKYDVAQQIIQSKEKQNNKSNPDLNHQENREL